MKKYVSILGLALVGFSTSIQAGCVSVAAAKQAPPAPATVSETPTVLYPTGHKDDEMSVLLAAYYLGGYVGQTNMQVASGGVITPRTAAGPSQGKPVQAQLSWSNGARVDFIVCGKGMTGHSLGLSYDFLTSSNKHHTETAGDYLATFAVNNLSNTGVQSTVTTHYHMPWFQEGRVWYNRGPIVYPLNKDAALALEPFVGVDIVSIHHTLETSYTDSAGNTMSLNSTELTYGGGPLAGFFGTFDLSHSFALRGTLAAAIPVMWDTLKQKDSYLSAAGVTTYGLDTNGGYMRPVFGANIDLDAVYRYDRDDFSMEFIVGWSTEQFLGMTSLMQATTAQGSQPGNFATNLVKAGFTFIW